MLPFRMMSCTFITVPLLKHFTARSLSIQFENHNPPTVFLVIVSLGHENLDTDSSHEQLKSWNSSENCSGETVRDSGAENVCDLKIRGFHKKLENSEI